MLYGYDVSMWQSVTPLDKDFVIIKASEGNGYKDPKLDAHYNAVKKAKKLYGFYHYARPDLGNTPEAEADWFLSLVGHHAGKCIYALDWEGDALRYPETWALRWCQRVQEVTGVKPLVYCSASEAVRMRMLYLNDYGLWVAHWGVYRPTFGGYPTYAIWQYQGSPIDKDVFNGDRRAWKAYCTSKPLSEVDDG